MPKLGFLALAVIEGGSCDIWVLRLKRYFVKRFFCGYLVSSEPYFLEDKHVFERVICFYKYAIFLLVMQIKKIIIVPNLVNFDQILNV